MDSTNEGSSIRFAELPRNGAGAIAAQLALCVTLLVTAAGAQTSADWRIDTVAGQAKSGDGSTATEGLLRGPEGVATDSAGNLFIADRDDHRIRKVDSTGTITTVAGTGEGGFSGDGGRATSAQLYSPTDVATDDTGNLYIADWANHRIRKVDSTGTITTVAGTGERGFSGDGGPATAARLARPDGVATDSAGNLFIADRSNHRIRKMDSTGTITTVAGTGERGFSGDGGPAVQASLSGPSNVAVDDTGNVYIADTSNHRIRLVDSSGTITTVAGTGERGSRGDGGSSFYAWLYFPVDVALDGAGNLYIAGLTNRKIRKIDFSGASPTFGGTITSVVEFWSFRDDLDDVPRSPARLGSPVGVALDGVGNLYFAVSTIHQIRKVDSSGTITTFAGSGELGDGGPATAARLARPHGVATDSAGNLYIADRDNHRIRKVDFTGTTTTVAGNGYTHTGGWTTEHRDGGPAADAHLFRPVDVALDGVGNLYIADSSDRRIRKVDPSGTITTFAGTGERSRSDTSYAPGPATAIPLDSPVCVAVDREGNVYIADIGNHRIRKVDSSGTLTTVAGYGERGFSGDGGPATDARLNTPARVAVDYAGNLYIADIHNHRIRKVDSSGVISTVAGTGERGFGGDGGPATAARLERPHDVTVDDAGNLYIADWGNSRIRKVDSSGVISTVAGTGERGFSGDGGPAIAARLDAPVGVVLDGAGNLYIADPGTHRIRVLTKMTGNDGEQAPLLEGIRDLLPF